MHIDSSMLTSEKAQARAAGETAAGLDVVPPEILEPLAAIESRNLLKREAAELLDGYLMRLARREALGRRVLGRIAAAFVACRGHGALGFARAGDYARERLGLSASQLYETARVSTKLDELPAIAAAFARGRLGWTKVRELTAVAEAASERAWLAVAREYTADALHLVVKRVKAGADVRGCADGEGSTAAPIERIAAATIREATREADRTDALGSLLEAEADEIDGEPRTRFALRCPRRVRRLWGRAVELARRMEGAEVAVWQAAEAVAAEALSTRGHDGSGRNGFGAPVVTSVAHAASGASGARPRARHMSRERFLREVDPDARDDAWLLTPAADDFEEIDVLRMTIDRRPMVDALPDAIEDLARGLDGADARELDRRMRAVLGAMQRVDWQMGRLLRTMFSSRLHLELGYLSEGAYARNRLGVCSRKARGLVAIERKSLHFAPALGEAYRGGSLSWLRALLLVSVTTEANAGAWIDRARAVTFRRLADEIAWALEVAGDSPIPIDVMPPPLGADLTGRGGRVDGAGIRARAAGATGRQIRGHDGAADGDPSAADQSAIDARIRFEGPASVVALVCEAIASRTTRSELAWRGLERVLLEVVGFWESQPRHRDPIFERDGWRCVVPACTSRRNLHDHHVVFRSRGGGNAGDNRVTVCAWHHLRAIHRGIVRAFGSVSDGIVWELGIGRGREPFMRLRGDAYLPAAAAMA